METNEIIAQEEEKEPIYYAPKRVSLISDVASILSWVVLVAFIADFVIQVVSLQGQIKGQNLVISTLLREPSFFSYLFTNMVRPLLTGLGFFAILQGIAVGLNLLLEMDFNARESKGKGKA
jgi:hypothetical protein